MLLTIRSLMERLRSYRGPPVRLLFSAGWIGIFMRTVGGNRCSITFGEFLAVWSVADISKRSRFRLRTPDVPSRHSSMYPDHIPANLSALRDLIDYLSSVHGPERLGAVRSRTLLEKVVRIDEHRNHPLEFRMVATVISAAPCSHRFAGRLETGLPPSACIRYWRFATDC